MDKESLVKEFNDNFRTLIESLATLCPNSFIANHLDTIKDFCNESNEFVIRKFVLHVLEHKPKIDAGDEDFFLKKDYSNETGSDQTLNHVLEFKSVWGQLSQQDKEMIKLYMQVLCSQTEKYFLMIDEST